ncbi:MAG: bifunctional [glutamate--ammonia ligase]-adenylyl-L-tyrosine phosphorylase/[glutamate--ammonia-ligase] adenylyltransferase, partial [Methylococcaceae bacterium]|nr:bifunctional [glutamate--ammonia ligase]-adenylyl-L-tyrosine phosphorylase/[glutamate--ammonia-ligase] adenylyltransferase [Methylococcaceae bacterium]
MIDLAALTKTLPESLRPAVLSAWEIFRQNAAERSDDELPDHLLQSLPAVWATSPFIAGHCARRPELLFQLSDSGRLARAHAEDEYQRLLDDALSGVTTESELMQALRRFRNREMVRIAWRDIAGWAPLNDTLAEVSLLAETCVQAALDFLFRQACEARGTPLNLKGAPQNLVVLGMGKLGAHELNFSSDIDLIFAYRDEGELNDRRG